jgi:hypothetical protein
MLISSHADDGAVEAMLAVAQCRYRVMQALSLSWRLSRGAMSMPSHAGDGAAEAMLAVV